MKRRIISVVLVLFIISCGDDKESSQVKNDTGTGVDTHSDRESDSTIPSDANTDTVTDTNTATDTDTAIDTETCTGTDTGIDTGNDCTAMNWACGSGLNNMNISIDCTTPGCTDTGVYCNDTAHQCDACNIDAHCGADCQSCDTDAPRCDGTQCVQCLANADCIDTEKPFCDTDNNSCVECVVNGDCRDTSAPNPSSLGLCTPDKICTCYEDSTDGCQTNDDCPTGYKCGRDFDGPVANDHFACLRDCTTIAVAQNGIECAERDDANSNSVRVWAPMASCYAFSKFGSDCELNGGSTPDPDKCRTNATLNDGTCGTFGGEFKCTYSCHDGDYHDEWCPELSSGCISLGDNLGTCSQ